MASVKLHVSGASAGPGAPDRFAGTFTVAHLIMRAYGLQAGQQLVGPDWIRSLFLDVQAKLPEGATQKQIPRLLQTLLADRLKLAVHEESRVMPVYELTVGKSGSRMKEVEPSRFSDEILRSPRLLRGHLRMPLLAYLLTETLDRYVLDSTGLEGVYDVDLQWTPVEASVPPHPGEAPQPPPPASDRPDLFTALQQQLGLKLESGRAAVKVVVVDHVERVPTAN